MILRIRFIWVPFFCKSLVKIIDNSIKKIRVLCQPALNYCIEIDPCPKSFHYNFFLVCATALKIIHSVVVITL